MSVRFFLVLLMISFSLEARPPIRGALSYLSGVVDSIRRAVAQKQLPHDSELVHSFERVVTQKQADCRPIDSSGRNLVMSTRWLDKIDYGWIEPKFPGVGGDSSLPHVRFHKTLAERIEAMAKANKWELFSGIEEKMDKIVTTPGENIINAISFKKTDIDNLKGRANASVGKLMGKAFMDGQCLSLEGFTQFSKVLITMSQSPRKGHHRFFVPIEQAMPYRTLGEYRRNLALLKDWGSYSHFGLAVIPAGAYVSIRLGPVAQQMFPNVDLDYDPAMLGESSHIDNLKDIEVAKKALSMTEKHKNEYQRFCEHLHGGATQILFAYAYNDPMYRTWQEISTIIGNTPEALQGSILDSIKHIPVYSLDRVLYDPREADPRELKLEFKNNKSSEEWDPDKIKLMDSHFFMTKKDNVPVAYDDIKIDFSLALKRAGILSQLEYEKFQDILKLKVWGPENRK